MYLKGTARGHGRAQTPEEVKSKVDDMLKNLGERVLQALGTAGKKVADFDRAYADKVYEGMGDKGRENFFRVATSATPIEDMLAQKFPGEPLFQAQKYGIIGSNLASRYALPAGGAVALQQALASLYDGASDIEIVG